MDEILIFWPLHPQFQEMFWNLYHNLPQSADLADAFAAMLYSISRPPAGINGTSMKSKAFSKRMRLADCRTEGEYSNIL